MAVFAAALPGCAAYFAFDVGDDVGAEDHQRSVAAAADDAVLAADVVAIHDTAAALGVAAEVDAHMKRPVGSLPDSSRWADNSA